jgi:hypothetical protein
MVVLALLFPVLLMLSMLLMERVEQPLRTDQMGIDLETFLDTARPEEVELFVQEGYATALDRYWRRRRALSRLAPS